MEKTLRQIPSNCIKVVLFGPESTGKSTLAEQLATYYETFWVPEFSRSYAKEKLEEGKTLMREDVLPIAYGQIEIENRLSKLSNKLLICDTDLLETKVYSEMYYDGFCPKILKEFALKNTYDLYLLTNIDIPWEADEIRDRPNQREDMFQAFQDSLIEYKKPYFQLNGTMKERFDLAINQIDKLLESKK